MPRYNMLFLLFFLTYAATGIEIAHANDTVDNAYILCKTLENTGLLSDKCEISGWNQTVSIVMDTSASEARKICAGMSSILQQRNLNFDRGWKLRIHSPYSGEQSIAICNL